jgi:hypothetical protein
MPFHAEDGSVYETLVVVLTMTPAMMLDANAPAIAGNTAAVCAQDAMTRRCKEMGVQGV